MGKDVADDGDEDADDDLRGVKTPDPSEMNEWTEGKTKKMKTASAAPEEDWKWMDDGKKKFLKTKMIGVIG